MSVNDLLLHAQYKSYKFLWLDESVESGKKTVTHEYPNSDRRYTEELGTMPEIFHMTILIHGSISERIKFENVLKEKGPGVLIHPIYGTINGVVATTYGVSSDLSRVGEFRYNVTFEVTSTLTQPSQERIGKIAVYDAAQSSRDNIQDTLGKLYKPPISIKEFTDVRKSTLDIFTTLRNNTNKIINPIQESAAEFNAIVDKSIRYVNNIIQSAESLKQTFGSIYSSILNIVNTPDQLESYWKSLVNYGKALTIPRTSTLDSNTTYRKQAKNNLSLLDQVVVMNSVVSLPESIVSKNQLTTEEIIVDRNYINREFDENVNNIFDYYYNDIFYNDLLFIVNDQQTRDQLILLKNYINIVMNDKIQNSWKIRVVNTNLTSFSLLSYRYYGNIDYLDDIINLNKDKNSSAFRNDVNILSN